MKLSAKKMGSMKAVKDSLKKGGSSGNFKTYIKNIPADGLTVRFLTEPEEWFGYYEYWDDSAKTFVPMVEGEILPDGAKPSFRYLTNALDIDNDRVIPLKLAKTAANVLILKYDKYDTMMDRNYEVQKHGEGLDTTYDVTPDAPSKMVLTKYDLLDLEQILSDARAEATGDKPDESDAEEEVDKLLKPAKRGAKKAEALVVSAGSAEEDDDDGEDTDDDEVVTVVESELSAVVYDEDKLFPDGEFRTDYSVDELKSMTNDDLDGLADWWTGDGYDVSFDKGIESGIAEILACQTEFAILEEDGDAEEESDEDDDEDDVEYTEEDLRAMTLKELKLIADDLEIDTPRGATKETLVDLIIEAAEA